MADTISVFQMAGIELKTEELRKQLMAHDPSTFEEINDLWKPTTPGEVLYGVLLAKEKSDFVSETGIAAHWWLFAAHNPRTDEIEPKRILGTVVIERALAHVDLGTPVQIEFRGEEKTGQQRVRLFTVRIPPKSKR